MATGANEPTLASAISGLNDAVLGLNRLISDQNTQRQTDRDEKKQEQDKKKREGDFNKNVANLSRGMAQVGSSVTMMVTSVKRLSDSINALADTQRRLGVSLTTAVDVRIGALAQSSKSQILAVKGLVDAIKGVKSSFGPPVRPQDILEAQQAYAEEFGAIISSAAGRGLAQEASRMGVTADKIVKSTRIFMGASLNDYNRALGMQSKFMTAFRGQGLAPRAAYEAIIKYSDLIARNGDRFAMGFARAAADAKKIGADLNKIEQFADSMADDFEGFLEKQGELAAMGFQFDSSRLLTASASGSTEDFLNELRSQLANTGKNLENLNRFERRAIENAFGVNIGEIQRLAGVTPNIQGTGEGMENTQSLVSDIKRLLEGSNNPIAKTLLQILNKFRAFERVEELLQDPSRARALVYGLAGSGGVIGLVITGLGLLGGVLKPVVFLIKGLGTVILSIFRLLGIGGVTGATGLGTMTPMLRVGQGLFGGILGFLQSRKQGASFMDSLGGGVLRGGLGVLGGSAIGGMLGTVLGPVGTVIGTIVGGYVGDLLGKTLNERMPQLRELFGSFFSGMWDSLKSGWTQLQDLFKSMYEEAIKPMVDEVSDLFKAFLRLLGGTEEEGLRRLKNIFKDIGFTIGTTLLYPLELLMGGIKVIVNIIRALAAVAQGDWKGAGEAAEQIGIDLWNTLKSPFVRAYDWSKAQVEKENAAAIMAANAPGMATGGLIQGPGTTTSDSILARLSKGEFVLNARATQAIGADALYQLNRGNIPGFSAGTRMAIGVQTRPTPMPVPGREVPTGDNELRSFLKSAKDYIGYGGEKPLLLAADIQEGFKVSAARQAANRIVQNQPYAPYSLGVTGRQYRQQLRMIKEGSIPVPAVKLDKIWERIREGIGLKYSWSDVSKYAKNSKWLRAGGTVLKNIGSILGLAQLGVSLAQGDFRTAAKQIIKVVAGKALGTLAAGLFTGVTAGWGAPAAYLAYAGTDFAVQKGIDWMFDKIFPSEEMKRAKSLAYIEEVNALQRRGIQTQGMSPAMLKAMTSANRMHTGGIVGATGPNEVPTILEQGEAVFTASQYGRFKNIAEAASTSATPIAPVVNFDTGRLEAKLDMMINAIASMEVKMDGVRVGNVLARSTNAGYQIAALRQG